MRRLPPLLARSLAPIPDTTTGSAPVVLLTASLGGHLHELESLAPRLVPAGYRAEWLVPAGPQSERLAGPVHHVPNTRPRDWRAAALGVGPILSVLRQTRPVAVVSTGAALAVPALIAARSMGVEAHYIESCARPSGPSLSGRLLTAAPGVHLYSQWPAWARGRWQLTGSVFDGFSVARHAGPRGRLAHVRRVVVTVGTQRDYGFRRLIARLVELLPPDAEVLWQVGCTDVEGLGIESRPWVDPETLDRAMTEADLIVAHAGIGSALSALEAGRIPILVPRRHEMGEHVDDHQTLIGEEISKLGLALVREVEQIGPADLYEAATSVVEKLASRPMPLAGRLGAALSMDRAHRSPTDSARSAQTA